MAKSGKRPRPHVAPLSNEDAQVLLKWIEDSVYQFSGSFEELESAIGMFFLGRFFGWKILVLIHNKRTIRKYEQILDIDIRKEFPEEGPFASKSVGLAVTKKLQAFWKAVSGEVPIEGRRELS